MPKMKTSRAAAKRFKKTGTDVYKRQLFPFMKLFCFAVSQRLIYNTMPL